VCGETPHCPSDDTVSGCGAVDFTLAPNASKLRFQCVARRAGSDRVKCGADLLDTGGVGGGGRATPAAAGKGRIALVAEPVSECEGPQFATTAPKKLATASNEQVSRFIATRIRKANRRFFDPGKSFCVRVRFTAKSGFSHAVLYDVTVPAER
jgi:hypothetical protein